MEEGITSIGDNTFNGCTGLTILNIPNTITKIGTSAFYGCSKWNNEINIKQFTNIGSYAFYNCSAISAVWELSDKITYIGESTFYNCQNITGKLIINENITSINNTAFYQCQGLTEITTTDQLRTIGTGAFRNCTGLTTAKLSNSIGTIGSEAFYNCTNLEKTVVPYQATIGSNAFYNVTEIHYDGTSTGSPWGAKKVSKCQDVTFTTTKAATCQTRGAGYYTCTEIGGKVNVILVELNHTPNYVNNVCSICGYKRRWTNTANGDSYKFVQNGGTWTSNNKGVAFSTATSTWTANLEEAETYVLKYKVSSEKDNDVFTLTLDGNNLVTASGNGSEVTLKLDLTAGAHTLVATYTKDSSNNGYDDMAYVVLEK